MFATCFPSINNRMKRSLPKFGARCTISRAVFPLGIGVGVGRGRASVLVIGTRQITRPRENQTLIIAFSSLLIHALSNPADLRSPSSMLLASFPSGSPLAANPGMRVLIADDQRTVGTSLADLVKHCNHEIVAVVGSGVEAIQAYTQHRPDVVLMDYWMPKLNGATACRNIVAKDPTARVILVSGWSPSNGIVGDSGALALLSKPVDLNDLAAALNEVAHTLPLSASAG